MSCSERCRKSELLPAAGFAEHRDMHCVAAAVLKVTCAACRLAVHHLEPEIKTRRFMPCLPSPAAKPVPDRCKSFSMKLIITV